MMPHHVDVTLDVQVGSKALKPIYCSSTRKTYVEAPLFHNSSYRVCNSMGDEQLVTPYTLRVTVNHDVKNKNTRRETINFVDIYLDGLYSGWKITKRWEESITFLGHRKRDIQQDYVFVFPGEEQQGHMENPGEIGVVVYEGVFDRYKAIYPSKFMGNQRNQLCSSVPADVNRLSKKNATQFTKGSYPLMVTGAGQAFKLPTRTIDYSAQALYSKPIYKRGDIVAETTVYYRPRLALQHLGLLKSDVEEISVDLTTSETSSSPLPEPSPAPPAPLVPSHPAEPSPAPPAPLVPSHPAVATCAPPPLIPAAQDLPNVQQQRNILKESGQAIVQNEITVPTISELRITAEDDGPSPAPPEPLLPAGNERQINNDAGREAVVNMNVDKCGERKDVSQQLKKERLSIAAIGQLKKERLSIAAIGQMKKERLSIAAIQRSTNLQANNSGKTSVGPAGDKAAPEGEMSKEVKQEKIDEEPEPEAFFAAKEIEDPAEQIQDIEMDENMNEISTEKVTGVDKTASGVLSGTGNDGQSCQSIEGHAVLNAEKSRNSKNVMQQMKKERRSILIGSSHIEADAVKDEAQMSDSGDEADKSVTDIFEDDMSELLVQNTDGDLVIVIQSDDEDHEDHIIELDNEEDIWVLGETADEPIELDSQDEEEIVISLLDESQDEESNVPTREKVRMEKALRRISRRISRRLVLSSFKEEKVKDDKEPKSEIMKCEFDESEWENKILKQEMMDVGPETAENMMMKSVKKEVIDRLDGDQQVPNLDTRTHATRSHSKNAEIKVEKGIAMETQTSEMDGPRRLTRSAFNLLKK